MLYCEHQFFVSFHDKILFLNHSQHSVKRNYSPYKANHHLHYNISGTRKVFTAKQNRLTYNVYFRTPSHTQHMSF